MGQSISINKYNIHKTHRFTDKMYKELKSKVNKENANIYETCFIDAMEPVFKNNLSIPIFNCIYINTGHCIISRRLNKLHHIEVKAISYNDIDRYNNYTSGYARLCKNKVLKC
jgi:hypothetical protein